MKRISVVAMVVVLSLVGCSEAKETKESTISTFEINSKTVSSVEELNIESGNNRDKADKLEEEEHPIEKYAEIKLNGMDKSSDSWVMVTDEEGLQAIEFKGKTYHYLYDQLDRIEYPCTKEQLLNFIMSTFETKEEHVYSTLVTDSEEAGEYDITVDESLTGISDYEALANKYGSRVDWELTVFGYGFDSPGWLYGNKDYIFYLGDGTSIVIDGEGIEEGEATKEEETLTGEEGTLIGTEEPLINEEETTITEETAIVEETVDEEDMEWQLERLKQLEEMGEYGYE